MCVCRSPDKQWARDPNSPACLLLTRIIRHYLLISFQVSTGVSSYLLDYVEDIYDDGCPLCPCFDH